MKRKAEVICTNKACSCTAPLACRWTNIKRHSLFLSRYSHFSLTGKTEGLVYCLSITWGHRQRDGRKGKGITEDMKREAGKEIPWEKKHKETLGFQLVWGEMRWGVHGKVCPELSITKGGCRIRRRWAVVESHFGLSFLTAHILKLLEAGREEIHSEGGSGFREAIAALLPKHLTLMLSPWLAALTFSQLESLKKTLKTHFF